MNYISKSNKLLLLFTFFLFSFSLFLSFYSIASAGVTYCNRQDGCWAPGGAAEQAYCQNSGTYECNCGNLVPSCGIASTYECNRERYPEYGATCNNSEPCNCVAAPEVYGCMDPGASNYNANATIDDGSCSYPPPPALCGNGVVNSGEQCDLGANNGSCPGGCSSSCTGIWCAPTGPSCGDGYVDPGEACDTGVNNGGCPRTCSNSCTVNTCGGSVATLTFTATGPGQANSPWGSCRSGTCILPLPNPTYVTIDAVHDFGGAFNWVPVCPASGSGARCEGLLNADYTAGVTFIGTTVPVINNVSISADPIDANASTQYTITHTASDSGGASKITQQYALINLQGGNAGAYRGYLTWGAGDWWPADKDSRACSGGGYAVIQSTGGNSVYGHDYLELDSCATSATDNTRVTTFTVRFNPLYETNGPWSDNDISGYVYNSNGNADGWDNFDINFKVMSKPSNAVISINPSPVTADGSTQHTITVNATDPKGGGKITHEYALINYQGDNAASPRGYFTWYYDGNYTGWNSPAADSAMVCTGGGVAAQQPGYGNEYSDLISCTSNISGNTRTVTFTIDFNTNFVAPVTNNDISGYIHNIYGKNTGWVNNDINFALNAGVPVVNTPTATSITTTGATLGATVASLGLPPSISARGTCWGTTNSPPLPNCAAASGLTTGVYSHARTGMPTGTTIYYQGYATNAAGTGYSVVSSFSTTVLPDLTAGASSPVVATVGVPLTFTATITNSGAAATGASFNNLLQVATAANGGGTISNPSSSSRAALSAGTSGPVTSSSYTFSSAGTYSVRICADNNTSFVGTITETNEGNNCGAWTNVTVSNPPAPSVTLSASPTSVVSGGSSTLTWTVGGSVTSCTASGGWSGSKSTSGGSQSTGALVSTQSYSLSCTGPGGTTVVGPVTVTVTEPTTYTLTVTANSSLGGSVTSSPGGINCGAGSNDCSESYPANTDVTLTATPRSSYWKFDGWSGVCSGTNTTCIISNLNASVTANARFTPRDFIYREF